MTWNIDNNASLITNNNDGSGTFNPSSLSAGPHTINYTWNNGAGCTITATQNITINPLVVPNSTNVSICSGSTATLTATGASVYNWYNAATAGTKVGSSNVYTTPVLSAPTSYWVSSGSGLCESARLKVDVTIKPDVVPTFNTIPAICQNAVAPLLQNPSNDSKTGTWNPSIINTSTAGTTAYVFTPTAGQCASVKTINITINPKVTPVFNLTSDICINSTGQSLPLTSDNAIPGTWVPSSIVTTTVGTSTYQFTPSAGQCAQGTTETINVLANPLANATPSVISGNPILNVDFTNSSTNATTLNWDFGNGSNSTVNGNASATYSSPGTYTVTLTAGNNICPDATWTQIIIVKPIDPLVVVIPNIFTPNNDQINDDYFLDVKNAETFEAAIYNRWGNELISLVHSSDKWNGKLSSGDLADEGTYFVKYKIVGYDKTVKEGVTFFHLHLGL
jgi:gliding motility-associated-like protein